jgi:uncharacterized repeat protein (TIGR03803 family)
MSPGGTLTTLHSFDFTDGSGPEAPLLQATNGNFYGTTSYGGTSPNCNTYESGCGTIFSVSVGLGALVVPRPTSGAPGTDVDILGSDLTGATSVTFNGTPATFKVYSSYELSATVPANATTGKIEVKTPSATLSSNVVFRVTP